MQDNRYLLRKSAKFVRDIETISGIDDIYSITLNYNEAGLRVIDYCQASKLVTTSPALEECKKYVTYLKKKFPSVRGFHILVCDEIKTEVVFENNFLTIFNLNKELQ